MQALRRLAMLIVASPRLAGEDAESFRLKQISAGLYFYGGLFVTLNMAIHSAIGEWTALFTSAAYVAFVFSLYIYLRITGRNWILVLWAQIFGVFLDVSAVSLLLGGFFTSGLVPLWAIMGPIGLIVFQQGRQIAPMIIAFVILIVVILFFGDTFRPDPPLLAYTQIMTLLNVTAISLMVFGVMIVYGRLLRRERRKSEDLLLNILPREIAETLKERGGVVADSFDNASVLFADIAEFTKLAKHMDSVTVVSLLNTIFSEFDELTETHGLEKIKTIGDCYMVAAGVPIARPDHASAICALALDMQAYLRDTVFPGNIRFDARFGINSGPLVAGVIGRRKYIYDLWGNTVNIASRAESSGLVGEIQVTEQTRTLVKDLFIFEERGEIALKGIGHARMHLLKGRRAIVDPISSST
jgi:adenylate cyclase